MRRACRTVRLAPSRFTASSRRSSRVRIHHLAFRTGKLDELERFYRMALGLERRARTSRSVWLAAGHAVLMLEEKARGEPSIPRASLELVCFAVRSKKELEATRKRVCRHARIEAQTNYTFYFRDPDGRRVGVSRYPVRRR